MTRRIALAVALAFTTIVTFGVVMFGAQHGLFSDPKTTQAAADAPVYTPAPEATAAAMPPLAPIVITRYQYVDDPAPVAPAAQVRAAPTATVPATPTAAAAAAVPPAAAPPPRVIPTQIAPAAAPTAPSAHPTASAPPPKDD